MSLDCGSLREDASNAIHTDARCVCLQQLGIDHVVDAQPTDVSPDCVREGAFLRPRTLPLGADPRPRPSCSSPSVVPALDPTDSIPISDLLALESARLRRLVLGSFLFVGAGEVSPWSPRSSASSFSNVSLFLLFPVPLPLGSSASKPTIISPQPSGCLPVTLASASRKSLITAMSRLLTFAVVRRRGA